MAEFLIENSSERVNGWYSWSLELVETGSHLLIALSAAGTWEVQPAIVQKATMKNHDRTNIILYHHMIQRSRPQSEKRIPGTVLRGSKSYKSVYGKNHVSDKL